jgi:hypothetical protein
MPNSAFESHLQQLAANRTHMPFNAMDRIGTECGRFAETNCESFSWVRPLASQVRQN